MAGFTICLFLGCGDSSKKSTPAERSNSTPARPETRPHLGKAPDFEKSDLSGNTIRLSDYRGKVLMLNFWATWCGPCRREIPALIELQKEFKEKLVIIGIALDEEGFDVVRPYAYEMGINYPVVMDDYSYGEKLGGIYMVPTTYIIDRQGLIQARKVGEISVDDIRPHLVKVMDK